jgi:hypothetical protein
MLQHNQRMVRGKIGDETSVFVMLGGMDPSRSQEPRLNPGAGKDAPSSAINSAPLNLNEHVETSDQLETALSQLTTYRDGETELKAKSDFLKAEREEVIVLKTRAVVEVQTSEIFLTAGEDFPLADTLLGSGPSQHHPETVHPIGSAVATALPRVVRILEVPFGEPVHHPAVNYRCLIQEPVPVPAGLTAHLQPIVFGSVPKDTPVASFIGAQL